MKKIFTLLFFAFLSLRVFAAPPNCGNPNPSITCSSCPDADTNSGSYAFCCAHGGTRGCPYNGQFGPINGSLIFLIIAGIGLGLFAVHKNRKSLAASGQ